MLLLGGEYSHSCGEVVNTVASVAGPASSVRRCVTARQAPGWCTASGEDLRCPVIRTGGLAHDRAASRPEGMWMIHALPTWFEVTSLVAVVVLLVVDLIVVGRRPHVPSIKESALWVAFYVGLAVAFGVLL